MWCLAAHERELDLILDFLDVKGAARIGTPGERSENLAGQLLDDFMHAARGRCAGPFDCKKRFGERNRNLALIKPRHRSVAADDLKGRFGRACELRDATRSACANGLP